MAWKEHFPQKGAPKAPCRFGVSGYSRNARLIAKVAIATVTLQEELGWRKGDRLRLFVGEGEHAGRIRLEPSPAGSFKVGMMRGTWVISLANWPGLTAEAHAMTGAEYQVQGSAITISLPAWALGRDREPAIAVDTAAGIKTATPAQIRAAQQKVASRPIGAIAKV